MGNRAVITNKPDNGKQWEEQIGIYLHWNGGKDSVEAFLKYCKLRGFRPTNMDNYGWARLTQIIANFFGGDTSIGIDKCKYLDCDNYDNGVYFIKDWEIVGRKYFNGQEQSNYDLEEMLISIDEAQPEQDRIGKSRIKEMLVELKQ